jgi:hypothetical protein
MGHGRLPSHVPTRRDHEEHVGNHNSESLQDHDDFAYAHTSPADAETELPPRVRRHQSRSNNISPQ